MSRSTRVASAVLGVFFVIHLVPFAVYGLGTALSLLSPPAEDRAGAFLGGVLIEKAGHALTFVLVFWAARGVLHRRWALYSLLWLPYFWLGEIGTAVRGGFTWPEAAAGMISEALYLPIAAALTDRLVGSAETS